MGRRTEMAYKVQFSGKSVQHVKAPGSGYRVNAAVVQRKFTSLSGEICFTCCGTYCSNSRIGPYRETKVQASPAVVDGDESSMETRIIDSTLR